MGFLQNLTIKKLENITLNSCGQLLFLLLYYNSHRSVFVINGAKRWINLGFMQLSSHPNLQNLLFCMPLATAFKIKLI